MDRNNYSFLWGVATSSHQIEGNNRHNDWWAWEQDGNIAGGIGSGVATDHWNRFREDICLAADLGVNSYRFSVEWSRIEPDEGRWDKSAIDWYRGLIAECEKYKLVPMLTLHHFTSPQWFAEKGGFPARKAPKYFKRYVEYVVGKLGERVPYWCTINEPNVLIVGSYLGRFMPPATFAPRRASQACANLLQCHVDAYDVIHSKIHRCQGPWKEIPVQVGFAHSMIRFVPERNWHPMDRYLKGVCDRFYNHSWLDAMTGRKQHFGIRWLIPYSHQVRSALNRRTVDFIGVNYYTKSYVRWNPPYADDRIAPMIPIALNRARRKESQSDVGWAIDPRGFRHVLKKAAKYGLPMIVTENGIADREDKYRPNFLKAHICEMDRLRKVGFDIRGYYHWSLIDNFEWSLGFGPRFGLYEVNYDTFERTARRSAQVYQKIIDSHKRAENLTAK